MADFLISNFARVDGSYNQEGTAPMEPAASEIVYTAVTEAQTTIVKSADKEIWTDGDLTYTIVFTNNSDGLSLYNVLVSDSLDSNISLKGEATITSSVGTTHDADVTVEADNLLQIKFNDEIAPLEEITIVFAVTKEIAT